MRAQYTFPRILNIVIFFDDNAYFKGFGKHYQHHCANNDLSFIFLVTGLIKSEYVKKLSKLNGVTIRESLIDSRFIKINKKNKKWHMTNIKISTKDKMEKLGFDFEKEEKHIQLL